MARKLVAQSTVVLAGLGGHRATNPGESGHAYLLTDGDFFERNRLSFFTLMAITTYPTANSRP